MSDLVNRLRDGRFLEPDIWEAADRIEAMEAVLRQALEALTMVVDDLVPSDPADRVWAEARRSVAAINDLLKD